MSVFAEQEPEEEEEGSIRGENNDSPVNASNNNAPSCDLHQIAVDADDHGAFFPAEEIPNDISNRDTLLVRGQKEASTEGLDLDNTPSATPLMSPTATECPVIDDPHRGSAYYSSLDSFVTAPEGPLPAEVSPSLSPSVEKLPSHPGDAPSSQLSGSMDTLKESSGEEDAKRNNGRSPVHRSARPQTLTNSSPSHTLSLKRGSRMRDPVKDDDSEPEEGNDNTHIEVLADVHVANKDTAAMTDHQRPHKAAGSPVTGAANGALHNAHRS